VFGVRTVTLSETAGSNAVSAADVPSAFDAFYEREFTTLAVLAGTVAANRSIGEDIAQEALARTHKNWPKVSAMDKPGAWARRVTINLAIGRKRRAASEARALFRLGPRAEEAAETRRGDPAVWAAVDELPPRQRAVIALHYLEDRPVADIAEILEISVSAATSNLHKARTNLATKLGETHA